MALWIIAGLVSIISLYFAIAKTLNYWKYNNVPQYHFLISLREILFRIIPYRPISDAAQKIYNDFPDSRYVGIYQFSKPILAVRDPDLIKHLSVKAFDHFVDHVSLFPEGSEPMLANNLFTLKGDKWRETRATLTPFFTPSKIKVLFGLISDYTKQFLTYFEDQKYETMSIEMRDIFTRYTNDVIATTAFGINCDSMRNPNNEFYIKGKELTEFNGILKNLRFLLVWMLPKIANMLKVNVFPNRIWSFYIKLLNETIESRENKGIVRNDMIHLLLEARKDGAADYKEGNKQTHQITHDDIVAQVFTIFFASIDGTTTLMAFMAHELAVNVDVQERLQTEVDEIFQECDGNLTYEALSKMKYMDMVIAETMRKWPSAIAIHRVCTKPYTIQPVAEGEGPVNLRKGDIVWFLVFGLHRDPQIFSDPEGFVPERFNEENKSKIPPNCYMPFGLGPRSCIGIRFGLLQTKLLFFYILSKFHFTVTKKTHIPLQVERNHIQVTAKGGFWLGLKPRN